MTDSQITRIDHLYDAFKQLKNKLEFLDRNRNLLGKSKKITRTVSVKQDYYENGFFIAFAADNQHITYNITTNHEIPSESEIQMFYERFINLEKPDFNDVESICKELGFDLTIKSVSKGWTVDEQEGRIQS